MGIGRTLVEIWKNVMKSSTRIRIFFKPHNFLNLSAFRPPETLNMLTEAASFLNCAPELFKASSNEYGENMRFPGSQWSQEKRCNWLSLGLRGCLTSPIFEDNCKHLSNWVAGYEELAGGYLNQSETRKYFEFIRRFLFQFTRWRVRLNYST